MTNKELKQIETRLNQIIKSCGKKSISPIKLVKIQSDLQWCFRVISSERIEQETNYFKSRKTKSDRK